MMGANTILHLHEGNAMTGADICVTPPSGYNKQMAQLAL
jgi:hypothetical protein